MKDLVLVWLFSKNIIRKSFELTALTIVALSGKGFLYTILSNF